MEGVINHLLSLAAELSGNGRHLVSLSALANELGHREIAEGILEAGYDAFDATLLQRGLRQASSAD